MEPSDVAKLDQHLFALVQKMSPKCVVDYLISASVLNEHHKEEIKKQQDDKEQNRRLITILKARGAVAFHRFLMALRATSQYDLATLLDEQPQSVSTYEELKRPQQDVPLIAEDLQKMLKRVQTHLKDMYLQRFQKTNPLSLPFTSDIENTWVSLALSEDPYHSQATDDHAKLLRNAFAKEQMLIIEGKPVSGKTSLMRRLAYEWAKEKEELIHYDLVVYAEFREVHNQKFESIVDLALQYNKNYRNFIDCKEIEDLEVLLSNKKFSAEKRILLLLDGYDESSLDKQCTELREYLSTTILKNPLLFNIVLTTRPGYLTLHRGNKGRFVFADVLGFTTDKQKKNYIHNHFKAAPGIDNKKEIVAVCQLLENNKNLDKLAKTPLFLTFICLAHERIIDATLLELYCNITWWLIDRHQKDFPGKDIPNLFDFENDIKRDFENSFEIIQDHYLQFPQIHCLGKMALNNLEKDIFTKHDYDHFNLKPILEEVGLLRKEKKWDQSFILKTTFYFPHKTIQEFLAALFCFCSDQQSDEWSSSYSKFDTRDMSEYEKFLLRAVLSDKMPINPIKRIIYFERIIDLTLSLTFDAFISTTGFNGQLLNRFIAQCRNIQKLALREATFTIPSQTSFSFSGRLNLHTLKFWKCIFAVSSRICITNCPSLKFLLFSQCEIKSSITLGFANLPQINTLEFWRSTFEANSRLTFANCSSLKTLGFNECKINSSTTLGLAKLQTINTLEFYECSIASKAWQAIIGEIASSSVKCLNLSFTEEFNLEFLYYLKECNGIEKIEIQGTDTNKILASGMVFSSSDLINLQTLKFRECNFETKSQLFFTNCPSLKTLEFSDCKINSESRLGIGKLSSVHALSFVGCEIALEAWKSITNEIKRSSIKCIKLLCWDFYKEFLIELLNCDQVEKIEIGGIYPEKVLIADLLSFYGLTKLDTLILDHCIFEANSQVSLETCRSLKTLQFNDCVIKNSTTLNLFKFPKLYGMSKSPGLNTLEFQNSTFEANSQIFVTSCPIINNLRFTTCKVENSAIISFSKWSAVDTLTFSNCTTDLKIWQLIIDEIIRSTAKQLILRFNNNITCEYLNYLQKCKNVEKIEITIDEYNNSKDNLLTLNDLTKLHSLAFLNSTFEANSQISIRKCPFMKILEFSFCTIENNTAIGFSKLPALDTLVFDRCIIDLQTWQLITDEITRSTVQCLKLSSDFFIEEKYFESVIQLQKYGCIEKLEIFIRFRMFDEEQLTRNIIKLAREMKGLKSIILHKNKGRGLKGNNVKIIEKAGQKRSIAFSISYAEE